jgi:hypothetical protein
MNPGRIAAFDRLADHAEAWPRLDPPRDELPELDPRDAALARMIERQAVRRWLTLKTLLERQLTRPWAKVEFPLQAALLGGAAQLFLMDRIPEHAAVDETVEWAKRRLRPGAGGRPLRAGRAWGAWRAFVQGVFRPAVRARGTLRRAGWSGRWAGAGAGRDGARRTPGGRTEWERWG